MNVKALFGAGITFARKHQGAILTTISIAGYGYSLYRAIKDSPKITKKLDELRESEATNMQKTKEILPEAAGIAVPFLVGVVSQLLCTKKMSDTIGSLANACTVYKAINDETKKAVKEVGGEELVQKVDDEVQKKFVGQAVGEAPTIRYIHTGHGNELFHDPLTGSWFYSDRNVVKDVARDLSYAAMYADVGVDEWAYALEIPHTTGNEDESWREGDVIAVDLEPKKLENDQLYYEIEFTRSMPKKRRYSAYDK